MILISNDSVWPSPSTDISSLSSQVTDYVVVAFSVLVIYDWVLTFGREVELVWRQHWSPMTVLYLSVRYAGILYAIICPDKFRVGDKFTVSDLSSFLVQYDDDSYSCRMMFDALNWMNVIVAAIVGVITIARLWAMHQQSRKVLIFLIVIFLAVNIVGGVIATIVTTRVSSEVLNNPYYNTSQCASNLEGGSDDLLLTLMIWILPAVWEVITLCLAVRIAVKRIRELQRPLTGWLSTRDCFTVLIKNHVVYFASFFAVSCFILLYASQTVSLEPIVTVHGINLGLAQTLIVTVMCVLGPRLILGIREYHAKLVANSGGVPSLTSIAFQERVHVSTGISV
ncbi:hypothetical protein CY34DRAFT_10453 [Suillus luteus UH-Slu-Lm8-n1]|uniref:DUF6533 domain-containing protein n=1 Tax=Suillus luteus UH-Slu-Lm8-n1 TaxID=930992 RepID=A0A0D0AUN3_9AGAM|nr:hypothetical protein CY34DRAFT_10453 [Suillus luteus UH-Slu-Lm8-n1]